MKLVPPEDYYEPVELPGDFGPGDVMVTDAVRVWHGRRQLWMVPIPVCEHTGDAARLRELEDLNRQLRADLELYVTSLATCEAARQRYEDFIKREGLWEKLRARRG